MNYWRKQALYYTLVVEFTEDKHVKAETFAQQILVDCLQARVVIVGADFHLGKVAEAMLKRRKVVEMNAAMKWLGCLWSQLTGEGGASVLNSQYEVL